MTIRQPPQFAGRLLKRLVPAQDYDALLGDLSEEYQRRGSVLWYCLQILAAIAVGTWKDIRTHRLMTLRAIGIGIASLVVYFFFASALLNTVTRRLQEGILFGNHWIYWRPWPGTFMSNAVPMLFVHAGFLVSGLVIGRLNRAHGITSAAAFAAFVGSLFLALYVVGYILLVLYAVFHIQAPGVHYTAGSSRDTYFSPVWMVLCIVIGGYFATRRAEVK
jgi:hypothetical protein